MLRNRLIFMNKWFVGCDNVKLFELEKTTMSLYRKISEKDKILCIKDGFCDFEDVNFRIEYNIKTNDKQTFLNTYKHIFRHFNTVEHFKHGVKCVQWC